MQDLPAQPRARRGPDESRAFVLTFVLQSLALTALGVLAVREGIPADAWLVVPLSVAVAVCGNRLAVFSTEMAATAEAAVLICAVVVFQPVGSLAAPVLIGVLSGWLDVGHWDARSFVRMACNSANRGLATLAAGGVFALAMSTRGAGATELLVAGAAAAAAFLAVDLGISALLFLTLGARSVRDALATAWASDRLTFPLAMYGVVAAILCLDVAWWVGVVALIPAAFVPEFVLVEIPRRTRPWFGSGSAAAVASVGVVCAALVAFPLPSLAVVVSALAIGVAFGLVLRSDARRAPPTLLAAGVVITVMTVGDGARFATWVTAGVASAVACALHVPRMARVLRGVVTATAVGCAAAFAASVAFEWFGVASRDLLGLPSAVVAGVAAAVVCEVVVGVAGWHRSSGSLAPLTAFTWRAPVLAAAATLGLLGARLGDEALVGVAILFIAIVVIVVRTGGPPWIASWAARDTAPRLPGGRSRVQLALAGLAVAAALAAAALDPSRATDVLAPVAAASAETVLAMALMGVRVWRFRPMRRATDVGLLLAACAVVLFGYLGLATSRPVAAVGALAAAVAVGVALGHSNLARADDTDRVQ